jgi:Tfp pilus assembly protein FimV
MTRTRVRVRWGRVAALAAALVLPVGAQAVAGASSGVRPASHRAYVVHPGDTLWSIAGHLAGPGADPRPLVDELLQANGGASVIVPGETLQLP